MGNVVSTEFLDRFADAWNRHDTEAIVAMMTPDCSMFLSGGPDPDGRKVVGREAVAAAIREAFAAMTDARWNDPVHFIAGDRGVTQWVFTATRPDGTKARAVGCDVFVFRDGLVHVKDSYRKQVGY
jgi:ketosteroid isomerase-like protein